jgi:hypothetical protein
MTEKKTFKHPLGLTSAFGDFTTDECGEYEIFSRDEGLHSFPVAEWDIEVTFTKKVKPLEVGQRVLFYEDGYPWRGEILWLDEHYVLISQNHRIPQLVDRLNVGQQVSD